MKEKYLPIEQNTCDARIFLNIFGLTLETIDDINESSIMKIFDKDMNEVGKLYFDNKKVKMIAKYNNSVLNASFDMVKVSEFIAMNSMWNSNITFQVSKPNNMTLSGEFLISSDTKGLNGLSCSCLPLINCEIPGKGKIILRISRDGSMFGVETIEGENHEIIKVNPWEISHETTRVKYDKENHMYPYRKYVGIFNAATKGEDEDKLQIFLSEKEDKNQITYRNELFPKVNGSDSNIKEILIQKGKLMQDLDPDMYKKIQMLRDTLLMGDISLLDNLVSVCYDNFSDEELYAILGINRQKMNYQNGTDNLVNSYFEIGTSNCLFPRENKIRLLKK